MLSNFPCFVQGFFSVYSPWDNEKSIQTWYLPTDWVCSLHLSLLTDHLWVVRSYFLLFSWRASCYALLLLQSLLTDICLMWLYLFEEESSLPFFLVLWNWTDWLQQRLQILAWTRFITSLSSTSCSWYNTCWFYNAQDACATNSSHPFSGVCVCVYVLSVYVFSSWILQFLNTRWKRRTEWMVSQQHIQIAYSMSCRGTAAQH